MLLSYGKCFLKLNRNSLFVFVPVAERAHPSMSPHPSNCRSPPSHKISLPSTVGLRSPSSNASVEFMHRGKFPQIIHLAHRNQEKKIKLLVLYVTRYLTRLMQIILIKLQSNEFERHMLSWCHQKNSALFFFKIRILASSHTAKFPFPWWGYKQRSYAGPIAILDEQLVHCLLGSLEASYHSCHLT